MGPHARIGAAHRWLAAILQHKIARAAVRGGLDSLEEAQRAKLDLVFVSAGMIEHVGLRHFGSLAASRTPDTWFVATR